MLKTLCFSQFSSLEGIFEASFCTAWANSKLRNCVFVEAKLSFFFTLEKKVWNLTFEVRISMFSKSHADQQLIFQLCHKHVGSSSKMEEEIAALWRHWKLRAHCQRFSLVPPKTLSFWAKAIGFHFFNSLHVESNCWAPATTKRLLNFTLVFFTNCCLLCETSVYLNCFERKSWRATAKRRWHKLLNQWIH